jgi:hypothetical protein
MDSGTCLPNYPSNNPTSAEDRKSVPKRRRRRLPQKPGLTAKVRAAAAPCFYRVIFFTRDKANSAPPPFLRSEKRTTLCET